MHPCEHTAPRAAAPPPPPPSATLDCGFFPLSALLKRGKSVFPPSGNCGLRAQSVNEKKQADVSTSAATIAFANTLGAASNQLAAANIRADEERAAVKAKKV